MGRGFPTAVDRHKPGGPEVPNGLGMVYVLCSVTYLFLLHYFNVAGALALACCILFGGVLGLFDDWGDLRWRYKAVIPILTSIPLISLRKGETVMATYLFGKVDFGIIYLIVIAPMIVTVTMNAVNQLGGLNGLETLCPLIVMIGLFVVSPMRLLLIAPIVILILLGCLNYLGRIFVGNVGTFAEGATLAAFAIIANIEQALAIALLPFLFNSGLVIVNILILGRRPHVELGPDGLLTSGHRRSLITLITYRRRTREHRVVATICLIVAMFMTLSIVITLVS
ncbi:TPA: hypothetical protein EYP44_04390 [Candidatus Bathyarchaeota archaeon]|nr:hypothetical protein [Candidatus Bathyarchaeota archaeon]